MKSDKEKYSYMLGISKPNVQGYANYIVTYCPSATGLRNMLQKIGRLMNELELQLNTGKQNLWF